jgi:hypothetical protein
MKIQELTISFAPSPSPDVAGYKLYVELAPDAVHYGSESFDLGKTTTVNLAELPGMTSKSGVYNLGITAVDSVGNESSMSLASNVDLDFLAPDPPGKIEVIRS